MCPRDKHMTREIGYMDFNLYKTIISRDACWTHDIEFCGFGEPLLHNDIVEMIIFAKSHGINIGITSNSTLLDEPLAEALITAGLDFACLDFSGTYENYEKIKKGAFFDETLKNLINFLILAIDKNVFTVIQFIQMKENESDLAEFLELFQNYEKSPNVHLRLKYYDSFAGTMKKQKIQNRKPCPIPWQSVCVLWNGEVVPCCRDFNAKALLGNLNDKDLTTIWNDKPMQQLRKNHLGLDFYEDHLCKYCTEFYSFNKRFAPLLDIRRFLK